MNLLSQIQNELKVPKNQYNAFGNYKYRSCDDIVETAKPILAKYDLALVMSDEVISIGDRYYVKSIARLVNEANHVVYEAVAYARESETKKGMDASQITGATSSYARKYALNGLFAIDDTKDADAQEPKKLAWKSDIDRITDIKELETYYKAHKDEVQSKVFNDYVIDAKKRIENDSIPVITQ